MPADAARRQYDRSYRLGWLPLLPTAPSHCTKISALLAADGSGLSPIQLSPASLFPPKSVTSITSVTFGISWPLPPGLAASPVSDVTLVTLFGEDGRAASPAGRAERPAGHCICAQCDRTIPRRLRAQRVAINAVAADGDAARTGGIALRANGRRLAPARCRSSPDCDSIRVSGIGCETQRRGIGKLGIGTSSDRRGTQSFRFGVSPNGSCPEWILSPFMRPPGQPESRRRFRETMKCAMSSRSMKSNGSCGFWKV